jgi:heterodisulfide reductase subunit A-like polyferredoxin
MTTTHPAEDVTGAVLVIGGGIAGMQASLDLAEQGYRAYLVESKSAIGGHMAQLDKTFPTNDCAMCIISPKLVETGRHLNIDLMVDTEVIDIEGQPGNFTVTLRHKPRYIDVDKCVGCGDCEEVCPITLPNLFNQGLSQRRAAFKLYPQAVPNAYAIDKIGIAPCRNACPAGQRAQGYIALIAEGRYREALRVIKEDNPFPSVCGRTCHHPCEGYCSRALVDDAVGIMDLKRFVVDYALAYGRDKVEPVPRTKPEWVAVVGAGPAGLTAAHDLVKLGYGVTVHEALPVAGGMMRIGIPAHRLPKGVLQQDIDDILALGVVLKTNSPIRNPTKLLKEGYHAVCLATGISTRDHSLGVEGEEAEGVISAATFLRKINLGEPITIGNRVAVVGGGITALDAAAVVRRLGAEEVYLALDRPRGELPAYHWEMAAVEAEGIRLLEHTTLTRILTENETVTGVELAKTGKGMTVDESGRRRPKIVPDSEYTLEVDTVIGTVGQQSDLNFLDPHFDDLTTDSKTLASEIPGLFVVGGRKTGASYIVEAISLGHRVATSIHRYLQGEPIDQPEVQTSPVAKLSREDVIHRMQEGSISLQPHMEPALLPMEERVTSFREVVLGLTERQARAEAQRCLQCGLCSECLACEYVCGTEAIDHDMVEHTEQIQVGSVILAPGYQIYQAEQAQEYGLGRYPNVITSLELERLLSASGPTEGHVQRPSDGLLAKRIAFLQCVGSRDQKHDYCSSVCCTYATKEAILIKEHDPKAEVQILMMDVRAFSKGYEAYYQRAKEQYDIKYTRCRVSEVKEDTETNNLIIRYVKDQGSSICDNEDDKSPKTYYQSSIAEETYDLVVLAVGMEISESVQQMAETLGVEIDNYGFCLTNPIRPVETSRPGIFAIGAFREPKDIPESVVDASGAAGCSAALLASARGTLSRLAEYPAEKDIENEAPRVGVFVCHCGSNIAGYVDVEAVSAYASQLPHVVHTDHLLYACSQDSTSTIQEQVIEHNLNRVVVASCTPRTHGPLFQDCLRQAGLNEHLFAMANIRNHCSWIHSDMPEIATAKAKDLVRMAVSRVATHESLQKSTVPVCQVALVIGGGPAGMNAALTIAEQGFPVHLVEREPTLGGNLRSMYFNLPLSETDKQLDPQIYLNELQVRIEEHPLITLHLESEVTETKGFVGDFTSQLKHADESREEISHGVTIVATGGEEYRGPEYGYGSHPRVLTQGEFETLLAEEVDLVKNPSTSSIDLEKVHQVIMIQCIGPAEQFCARICCSTALKNAIQFKTQHSSAQVFVLCKDVRTYGFKERLYRQALELGIVFIRYDEAHQPIVETEDVDGMPRVQVLDRVLGIPLALNPDLVILSMPMVPAEGSRELASTLKVPVDMDGWFLEAHVKLRPVEFASEGVFLAGVAHYPKLLDETIVQAQAAASRAATILSRKTLTAGGAIAHVDQSTCVGCLTCVRICPYNVPQIETDTTGVGGIMGTAFIEPTVCQGCGSCVGECPAQAIELLHYRHTQVESEVLSLFKAEALKEQM